jgi:DNA-binding NarL/FixJ family response regulator
VRLAGDGLTNREIADRLLLSPRTVSSHLYRSFPKLGITGRHQLRDVIARKDALLAARGRGCARRGAETSAIRSGNGF